MQNLTDIPQLSAEQAATLAENGVKTLPELRDADPSFVVSLFEWVSPLRVRNWQAHARTWIEADAAKLGKPSPEKWFIAVQRISVESLVPNFDVESGERVNLWFLSDEQIARMIAEKAIAPDTDSKAHLLVSQGWLPVSVRAHLAAGGIYTIEDMISGTAHTILGEDTPVAKYLESLAPKETVDAWLSQAKAAMESKPVTPSEA